MFISFYPCMCVNVYIEDEGHPLSVCSSSSTETLISTTACTRARFPGINHSSIGFLY